MYSIEYLIETAGVKRRQLVRSDWGSGVQGVSLRAPSGEKPEDADRRLGSAGANRVGAAARAEAVAPVAGGHPRRACSEGTSAASKSSKTRSTWTCVLCTRGAASGGETLTRRPLPSKPDGHSPAPLLRCMALAVLTPATPSQMDVGANPTWEGWAGKKGPWPRRWGTRGARRLRLDESRRLTPPSAVA
jgi:hypothetical protein